MSYPIYKRKIKGEEKMKQVITGIMILLFVLAVTFVPLSAKAEMKVMADNEMEMVTGQINGGQIIGVLFAGFTTVLTKRGVDMAPIMTSVTNMATPLMNTKLVKAIFPYLVKILTIEIPGTRKVNP